MGRQSISICYYDQNQIQARVPNPPFFLQNSVSPSVEKGYALFYQRRFLDLPAFSCYLGGDVAKWYLRGDSIYTTSTFLAGRVWLLHLLFLHAYTEYSVFGPTVTSKETFGDIQLNSNFLFQSFFSVGLELSNVQGVCCSIKMLKYTHADFSSIEAFQAPIIVSFGSLF